MHFKKCSFFKCKSTFTVVEEAACRSGQRLCLGLSDIDENKENLVKFVWRAVGTHEL